LLALIHEWIRSQLKMQKSHALDLGDEDGDDELEARMETCG
jgi:hypothetical protein